LFGAALSVKLMAVAFIAPAAAIACFTVARRKQVRAAVPAAMLLLVFAAPPYLYAWWKTGNPVFPFANSVFRSPYFPKTSLIDARYNEPLTWKTPYEATFRSSHFYEGRNGSFGFQYFLLLLPAAILMSRRAPRALLGIAVSASFMLLAILPNLRYLYPALAPFSVVIAYLASEMPGTAVLFVALTAINTWSLPASGWYHNEFALFRREQVGAYWNVRRRSASSSITSIRRLPASPWRFSTAMRSLGFTQPPTPIRGTASRIGAVSETHGCPKK